MYEKTICAALARVLYATSLKWPEMEDQKIHILLTSVPNPTTWPTFFTEAIGSSLQQELIGRKKYCPGVEKAFKDFASKDDAKAKTWKDLNQFLRDYTRNLKLELT